MAVVKQALRELNIDDKLVPPRSALSRISHAKNRMEGPDSLRGQWNLRDEQIAKIYEKYLVALKDSNALDFDDLLLKTVELFETSEQAREFLRTQVQVRDGRRVPGHEPAAVPADPPAGRGPPQPRGGRRSRTSRSTSGAAPTCATSSTSSTTSATPRSSASSRTTARRRSSSTPRPRSSARTATARTSGSGPTAREARKILYYRGGDELEEADFIVRTVRQARAEDVDSTIAVLYRTNAQSRAIEDSLMREGIPYKIIGGVRFYERKEIKDALAFLKLVINPHDDVSLRRVINVPARGIGKGVMDSLQAIDPDAVLADAPPLLAAGLQEISSARSLWAKLVYAVDEGKLTSARGRGAARVPRPDRLPRRAARDRTRSRSRSARCSIRPAT